MDTGAIVSVKTKIVRVLFPKTEIGFVKGFVIFSTDRCKMKGTLPFYPKPGMELEFKGRYETYQGELQFKFFQFSQSLPTDEIALLKYVATLANGIGVKTLESIIETYGAEWRSRLADMPDRISIPLRQTLELLGQNQARTDAITYLLSIGGTPRMGELAYERFKEQAIPTLKQNIYALSECSGIGFRTVDDKLRGRFGILDHDARRANAAVLYAIKDLFDSTGNTVVERATLLSAIRALNIPESAASVAVDNTVQAKILVAIPETDLISTSDAWNHETAIIGYLSTTVVDHFPGIDYSTASVTPDDSQKEAIEHALCTTGASIINGGAGSGKTTIVKIIADNLKKKRLEFSLCAFAGKAAARLREATGHHASTIHSLLGYQGEARGFTVGSLEGQTIIVDEASMLPSWLMYELCKRNPERLILVGDQAQIPPVGIGQPFHDMIKKMPRIVRTVTTCYRNREAIFQSAIAIREGNRPANESVSPEEKFRVIRVDTPQQAHKMISDWVTNNMLDFETDVILSPRNGEKDAANDASVNGLNRTLQRICNPHDEGQKFRVDDRVMFTSNFPKEQAWNGTTGWIHSVDTDGIPTVEVDSPIEESFRYVRCGTSDMRTSLVPCYAMTMHKSQGSQYRRVVIVCMRRDLHTLLDRALLYTAVTRAKKACVIVTDCDLQLAINSVRERTTLIQKLLK